VIGTPMQFHASQAIAALKRGIHVLSEVTAAVSVDECRQLVAAARASKAIYMMAENYTYTRPNVLVRELVRKGLFGDVYFAEGEYIHELKQLNEETPWRRQWHTGINGITYCTHSLGPILQWMPGDRVTSVCCAGSGHHHRDPHGNEYENEDTCVMLAKTSRGALIKIRLDMLSDRPHAMTNYQLQGTDGCYESSRGGPGDVNKIWLRSMKTGDDPQWRELTTLDAHLPDYWKNPPAAALKAGHGGGDFFVAWDFVRAILGEAPCPIAIHEAMDMTLPGLISQQSIAQNGAWLDVPDSRQWT
jgi:predicted dehydrogenase